MHAARVRRGRQGGALRTPGGVHLPSLARARTICGVTTFMSLGPTPQVSAFGMTALAFDMQLVGILPMSLFAVLHGTTLAGGTLKATGARTRPQHGATEV